MQQGWVLNHMVGSSLFKKALCSRPHVPLGVGMEIRNAEGKALYMAGTQKDDTMQIREASHEVLHLVA